MFDNMQFRKFIVVPTLDKLKMYSKEAEELLVFTCATESKGGTFVKQVQGPALGIYQIEPATYFDIWNNYILKKSGLPTILSLSFGCGRMPEQERLIYDLEYATVMCRLFYARIKDTLPDSKNIDAIWEYYKKYYNTNLGKATKEESVKAYRRFCGLKD